VSLFHLIADLLVALKNRGLLNVLKIILSTASDTIFDWQRRTNTYRGEDSEANDPKWAELSNSYQCTRHKPFLRLLKELDIAESHQFVDLGCGKGRAMLIALELGFKNVVGVEYNKELLVAAEKNLSANYDSLRYHLHEGDIFQFPILPVPALYYLYDPVRSHDRTQNLIVKLLKESSALQLNNVLVYHNNLLPDFCIPWEEGKTLENEYFCHSGNQFFVFRNTSI
jgi:SAM-dependent methyltransferase